MKKLILVFGVWALLSACENQTDDIPPIYIHTNNNIVAEGDTLQLNITRGSEAVTDVKWNRNDIEAKGTIYQLIVPTISTDTTLIKLIATAGNQTDVKEITVFKRAFKQPLVSYTAFMVPLLEQNCNFSGCHGNGSRAGKVNLSVYDSTARFVKPYSANQSLLMTTILRDDPLRWMPPAGKLHADKIETVRLWIEQGARNN